MCNEAIRIQSFIPQWRGRSVRDLFSGIYINPTFQYNNVHPGHCLVCKRPLAHNEMWPNHRCPRSMCKSCYHSLIVNQVNQKCIISGDHLPDEKIWSQKRNPREVENNIAYGYAQDYYTLVACKALGVDVSFLKDEFLNYAQSYHTDPYGNNEDVIDADYHVLPRQAKPQTPALPYLQGILKVPDMTQFHNGKRVKILAKRNSR